ncbi:MAG: metallophosphoesterase, partial [Gemmatimonadetes bacterium]|nr:metallophosphoesterase [Gemmatimonadota bacterium]
KAIALRATSYFVAAWGTLVLLSASLFPEAAFVTLAIALYTTIPIVAFAVWRGWPFYPGRAFRLLVVRPFWYAQLLLPLVSAAGLIGLVVGAPFGAALLVGRTLAGSMLAVALIVLVLGYIGARRLVVRRVDAEVPGLGAEFDGLRIVQLSDLHVGPHTSRQFLDKVVKTTQSLAPDLIAVTGDLIDDRAEDVAAYARALGSLDAPLGLYMIPGNHDVYAGWEEVERSLRAAKLGTVLVNDVHVLHRGEATIALVGTGDPAGGARGASRAAPDVERALARVPGSATVIAFAHNPALWPALAARGVALTLSGHTHWGQFALPKLGWSLASPFLEHAMGAHSNRDSLLYISPGTGYWGIPFRLGASPEVTLVTLHRGDTAIAHVHPARAVRRPLRRRSRRARASAA